MKMFPLFLPFEYFRDVPDGATKCHEGGILGQFWVTDTAKVYCKATRNITELTEKQGENQYSTLLKYDTLQNYSLC